MKRWWFVFLACVIRPRFALCVARTLYFFWSRRNSKVKSIDWYTPRGLAVALPWTWLVPSYFDPWSKSDFGITEMERFVTVYFRMLPRRIYPLGGYELIFDTFVGPVDRVYPRPGTTDKRRDDLKMNEGDTFPFLSGIRSAMTVADRPLSGMSPIDDTRQS